MKEIVEIDPINGPIELDHEKPRISEAFGLTIERAQEIGQNVIMLFQSLGAVTEVIATILKQKELNEAEKIYSVFVTAEIMTQATDPSSGIGISKFQELYIDLPQADGKSDQA